MAEWNPEVQDTGPVQYNRTTSEGPGVDKSMGTLFSGIGDALGSAVASGDNFVKNTITDAVNYSSNSVGTELGTNSQSYPVDIPASQAAMGTLTAAKNQGKISEEYYWQRMSNTMKGLRARFPGYEQDVDQAFQKVTGQNPANAFRDQLWNNINTAGNYLASQQLQDARFVQEHMKYLPPSQQDPNNVQGGVNGQKAMIYKAQSDEYQAQHIDEMSKFNKNMASDNYNTRVNQIAGSAIDYINKSLGTNSDSFTGIMQRFSQGGAISPENKNMLNQSLDGAIANITQKMTVLAAQPGYNQLPATEVSAAREKALDGLNQLKTMVNAGQYDQAAQLSASLNFQSDQRTQAAVQQFPVLGAVNAVTKLGGPEAGATLYNNWILKGDNANQMMDWGSKNFVGNIGAAAATGQMSMGDIAKATISNPGVTDPKQRAQLVLGSLSAFRTFAAGDFGQNPQQVRDFVTKVYGEDVSDNTLWRAVANPDKITMYTTMFDPQITGKILKTGDPNLIQQYQNSAMSYARSIPSIIEGAGTTAQQVPFQDILQVKFNPGTSRLEVGVAPGRSGFQGALDNNYIGSTLKPAIADLNRVIGVMAPMWKAEGIDPQVGAQKLVQNLGGSLKSNQGGFFNWMSQQITGPSDKPIVKGGRPVQASTVPDQISTPGDESMIPELGTGDFDLSQFRSEPTESDNRGQDLPAGMRNNNPGNIKYNNISSKWAGAVGPSSNTDQGDHQVVFQSEGAGIRAAYNLLQRKYMGGKITPDQIIAGENGWTKGNHQAAINVARTMGIHPDEDIDFSSPGRAASFMRALFIQEQGKSGEKYTEDKIKSALGQ